MMAEKVKVSREVAEEISVAKSQFLNPYDAIRYLSRDKDFKLTESDAVKAVNGYLNGYEIEQTPEEKILATYQRQFAQCDANDICDNRVRTAYANAILYTLDTLGVKIEGINK